MASPPQIYGPSLESGDSSPVRDLGNVYLLPWEDIGDQHHSLKVRKS